MLEIMDIPKHCETSTSSTAATKTTTTNTAAVNALEDAAILAAASNETATAVECQAIGLNGRPTAMGLRRQPTKYPHGLNITLTDNDDGHYVPNYSRASTLRSSDSESWADSGRHSDWSGGPLGYADQQKIRISMIASPETLAELQVRRYKYPLTTNYYLNTEDARHAPLVLLEYGRRLCRWKYLRWPIVFVASVLLFFGLITYCLWLHDVSMARERYLQRRYQLASSAATVTSEATNDLESFTASSVELNEDTTTMLSTTSPSRTSAASANTLLESTRLHAIERQPKEQKLTTADYNADKATAAYGNKATKPFEEDSEAPSLEDDVLQPAHSIRFTSGHQNSFGLPIEHDERILRLINNLFPTSTTTTATSAMTRVSPTIPPVMPRQPTAAMATTLQDSAGNGCYSTTLPMCQGVLDYDLTYNASTQLDATAQDAYHQLINSNCSERAVEFVCAALEPECRPTHIGKLLPCRRICKAVREACSIVIASSDVLSELFDCPLYPDSSDPHKCEDPTRRRDFCYENEFECYDSSCIPYQWQCDNIKDCDSGEDEDHCLICEHQDEFRCHSNEKCVPEATRCDQQYDCFDGSDEDDCDDYGSGDENGFDVADLNSYPRIFSYASFLSPNETNDKLYTYITANTDEDGEGAATRFQVHEIKNFTSAVSSPPKEEEVTNAFTVESPKGFGNFRDSKEIMMTSDSENKFKYSAARSNRTSSSKFRANTTPLQPAASQRIAVTTPATPIAGNNRTVAAAGCAPHQLRCVSGKCITVSQLCDKKIDCPDGADELMCVYKERTTTRRSSFSGSTANTPTTTITTAPPAQGTRADKRTIRTTIKRKPKT